MKKKQLRLDLKDYKKLFAKLQEIEKSTNKNAKINGISLSNYLLNITKYDEVYESPIIRAKKIILHVGGNYTTKPENLNNSINLKINMLFGSNEYSILRRRLEELSKEYKASAKISNDEINNCSTVGDCITLFNSKIV